MNIFLTGGSSGIGKACFELLVQKGHSVTAPTRNQLNLSDPHNIEHLSLSEFDVVLNCAGSNIGTYLGFYNNTTNN